MTDPGGSLFSCPMCGKRSTKVVDSRHVKGPATRRRRHCYSCGQRFTTYETVIKIAGQVIRAANPDSFRADTV